MRSSGSRSFVLVTALALAGSIGGALAPGQTAAQALEMTGLAGRHVILAPAQIAALPYVSVTVGLEGRTHVYDGILLTDLLDRVGAPSGKDLKGADLSDVVLVSASDGYVVALSLAETDPMVRKDRIILADKADGQPLPAGVGPYRLVVEGDLRGARSERMVRAIDLRRLAPAPGAARKPAGA
jgi:DMSO/TMAO reductase YedYZ molybdopterin-dependent catalytic subunit